MKITLTFIDTVTKLYSKKFALLVSANPTLFVILTNIVCYVFAILLLLPIIKFLTNSTYSAPSLLSD